MTIRRAAVADSTPDIGEESLADVIADVEQPELTRDLLELRDLGAALKRLADGSYGVCPDCGCGIQSNRLWLYPSALRCVRCQRRHEKTHTQSSRSSL